MYRGSCSFRSGGYVLAPVLSRVRVGCRILVASVPAPICRGLGAGGAGWDVLPGRPGFLSFCGAATATAKVQFSAITSSELIFAAHPRNPLSFFPFSVPDTLF